VDRLHQSGGGGKRVETFMPFQSYVLCDRVGAWGEINIKLKKKIHNETGKVNRVRCD
jgi:hypothetical protein